MYENYDLNSKVSVYFHYKKGHQERKQKLFKTSDQVIIKIIAWMKKEKKTIKFMVNNKTFGLLQFLKLIGKIEELYRKNSIKNYYINNLIFYMKRKYFQIYKINVL